MQQVAEDVFVVPLNHRNNQNDGFIFKVVCCGNLPWYSTMVVCCGSLHMLSKLFQFLVLTRTYVVMFLKLSAEDCHCCSNRLYRDKTEFNIKKAAGGDHGLEYL